MAREYYGVRLTGCSGTDLVRYRSRSTADRVRRVIRAWIAQGEWSGWATLNALAEMAAARPGATVEHIIDDFRVRAIKRGG